MDFNTIIANIRTNGTFVEFDASRALQGLAAVPKRILVIGQMLAGGIGAPLTPLQILSGAQAEILFGRGSMLASMLDALKAANPNTECWAIGMADPGGGTKATYTMTLTGPATASGEIDLYIGGEHVPVTVTSGDSVTTMAANIATAVNAQTDLPVTATAAVGVVTLTMLWKGLTGNSLDLRTNYQPLSETTPAGVTVVFAAGTAGAGEPDLMTAIAVFGDRQYNIIVTPYTDATSLTDIETELERRWGGMVQQDGLAFSAASGAHSALTTLGESRNSKQVSIMGAGVSPTAPWIWAAVVAAVDANEPDPARPRQTLPLPGILPPAPGAEFDQGERNLLLFEGISTYTVDQGGNVAIERLVTTYQTNSLSVADASYLDVTSMETLANLRYTLRAWIATNFPRSKLADDGTPFSPGQAIVTPSLIKGSLIMLFGNWQDAGLVQDAADFKADLTVLRNGSDVNRVDVQMAPKLMAQFVALAAQIQFIL